MRVFRTVLPALFSVVLLQGSCAAALWLRQVRLAPPDRPTLPSLTVRVIEAGLQRTPAG
jgi:hypothetical protein